MKGSPIDEDLDRAVSDLEPKSEVGSREEYLG